MPVATRRSANISTSGSYAQPSIQRFAQVIKPITHATDSTKLDSSPAQLACYTTAPQGRENEAKTKRKRQGSEDEAHYIKRPRREEQPPPQVVTPRRHQQNPQSLPTPGATPVKAIQWSLPPKLHLDATGKTTLLDTPPVPPSTHHSVSRPRTALPDEVFDLIQLNAAFLRGLSLHFAHTRSVTPVDVRILRPSVTKIWGKRKTTLDDIRRCLSILHMSGRMFNLYDYDHNRICIERAEEWNKTAVITRHLDEDRLNDCFEATLKGLWQRFQTQSDSDTASSTEVFISGLVLEPIVLCPSLKKIKLHLLDGQRRLEDLKGISLQRRTIEKPATALVAREALARKSAGVIDRSSSLLSRLKAKAKHAASLPAPASADQLERRSALSRLHEIIPILAAPKSKTSQRTTQALPMLVQIIQGSARNSLSSPEIKHSLELLHRDICWNGFMDIIQTGGVTAVVVDRTMLPADWTTRINTAVASA